MKLKQLLKGLDGIEVKGSKEIELTGLSNDSRLVVPGHLFLAKPGAVANGADYIPQALASGASAIVTDLYDPFIKVPQILVKNPGSIEAFLAKQFYADPSKELYVVAVTGTKGKTTTSYMVRHLLQSLGMETGLASTVETIVAGERKPSPLTTQNSIQNQRLLREMVSHKCTAAVLEVSSHGLEQQRVDHIAFDCALFTNLSTDHLDYHETMEKYAIAKRKLFEQLDHSPKKNKRALINHDSPWSGFMHGQTSAWTFGMNPGADIYAHSIQMDGKGTRFRVEFDGKSEDFSMPVLGRFNVYNALGAIGVGLHRGASLTQIAAALQTFQAAPGRLEPIMNDQGLLVFVDFAHMGEALENVLKTLREIATGKLICVFGCGGNRDPMRRMTTAKAAEKFADLAIITSDNPRKEDPMAICQEILANFQNPQLPLVEVDRRSAIMQAMKLAKPGDIVLIAGKGHEKGQILAHQTIPFDDCLVAKEALQLRGSTR